MIKKLSKKTGRRFIAGWTLLDMLIDFKQLINLEDALKSVFCFDFLTLCYTKEDRIGSGYIKYMAGLLTKRVFGQTINTITIKNQTIYENPKNPNSWHNWQPCQAQNPPCYWSIF